MASSSSSSSIPRDLGSSNGSCSSEKDNPFQSLDRKTTEEEWMKCGLYLLGRNNILKEEVLLFERMFRERYTEGLLARLKETLIFDSLDVATKINYTEEIKVIFSDFDSQKLSPEPSAMKEGDWKRLCASYIDWNRLYSELLKLLKMRLIARGEFKLENDLDSETSGFSYDLPVPSPGGGPVLRLINKHLRSLRKKFNRILMMEKRTLHPGRKLNKDQEVLLQSKPTISAQIVLLEELREPLASAVSEELSLSILADIATFLDLEKAIEELRARKDSNLTEEQWKIRYSKCWKENVTLRDKLDELEREYRVCNLHLYLPELRHILADSGVLATLDKDEDEEDSVFDEQNEEVIGEFYDTEGGVIKDWERNFKKLRRQTRWYKAEVELFQEQLDILKKTGIKVPSRGPVDIWGNGWIYH